MQGIARTGDAVAGICNAPGHPSNTYFTGVWASAHSTITADGLPIVLTGDTGHASCGHTFIATLGSPVLTNGTIQVHRQGDPISIVEGSGSGTTVTGSTDITSA